MPFTFFAHQSFVMPLKAARPRWFDGTALCIGSMAPDLAYATYGTPLAFDSHKLLAQLTWSLPVALILTLIVRRVLAEPVGLVLPGHLGVEVRALSRSRHPPWVMVWSALVGALSHIFVDGFTHTGGWAATRIPWLQHTVSELAGHTFTVAGVFQDVGHVVGTAAGIALLWYFVSRRRFSTWSGVGPDVGALPSPPPPPIFWVAVAGGLALAALAAMTVASTGGGGDVAIIRAAWAFFPACAGGAWLATRVASLRRSPRSAAGPVDAGPVDAG
jgi:hypothetical protein